MPRDQDDRLTILHGAITKIRADMFAAERQAGRQIAALPDDQQASARNLVHYTALRQHDLRSLQSALSEHGLSSLGRCEAHALASVERLLIALAALLGAESPGPAGAPPVDHRSGPARLAQNAERLLGPSHAQRDARIMVTLSERAATDPAEIAGLLAADIELVRINCAHDGADEWLSMITQVRQGAASRGRPCRVLMDLAGPKLRTGKIAPGEQVVHWRPHRDAHGRVTAPARILIEPRRASGSPPPELPPGIDGLLPVSRDFRGALRTGDTLSFADARAKLRTLRLVEVGDQAVIAELESSAYLEPGTHLRARRGRTTIFEEDLGSLPPLESALVLADGDVLVLTDDAVQGRPAQRDEAGRATTPATIPCSLPQVFADVHPGEQIWFDDGKIGGVIREAHSDHIVIDVRHARDGRAKLRSDKGINLPDSSLTLPCMTDQDRTDLAFAVLHADLVGLSFLREAKDVRALSKLLDKGAKRPGLILKIETPQAFSALPAILMAGLAAAPLGIMVARGDLAVEIGFARLAEVQEEILWLSEAAHLPVIWGTQVLETLAKKGIATRAEVSDAAMSVQAECVMLNKGPHIIDAVRLLADVLNRMQEHQVKKTTLMRRLAVSGRSPRS